VELTAIGYVLLPVTLCLSFWPSRLAQLVIIAGVFGAAAPIVFSVAGGLALPSAFLPGLVFIAIISWQPLLGMRSAATPEIWRTLFPFLLFALWALVSAYLLPRIFADDLQVWPQRLDGDLLSRVYLEPNSGNITQGLYLLSNTVMLIFGSLFFAQSGTHERVFLHAYLLGGYLAVGICFWELASKLTGLYFPQEFLYSNPRWAIFTEQTIRSVPRINGSFTEPAGLAGYLSGIIFATVNLSLRDRGGVLVGILLVLSILAMLSSTSTTGLVIVLVLIPLLVLRGLVVGARGAVRFVGIGLSVLTLLGVVGIFALPAAAPRIEAAITEVTGQTLDKSDSQSYETRTTMDTDSVALLAPSYGLGAGWGSVRSSSLIPGILGNCGVLGLLLLLWFTARTVRAVARARRQAPADTKIYLGAMAWSLLGNLCAALLSGPTIDEIDFFLRLALVVGCTARLCEAAAHEGVKPLSAQQPPLASVVSTRR
jgi:hypothetical protein